jgi:hypothetical protein
MADLLKASIGVEFKGQAGLNQAAAAIGKTEVALKKLSPGSDQATQSLVNLSRVAQDAPYGFIGIANNINPLLESFQRLKASTGTTGGALKALGKELTGAGGIGLAVGVVSSLLVVFGDKLFGTSKKAKEAADELEKVNKVLNEVNRSFGDVQITAGGDVADEIAKVQILSTVIQDQTKSYKERNNALEQLKSINKNYFGDLTLESSSLASLTSRVNEYTNALIAAAVVKEFSSDIAKVTVEVSKQLNSYNQLNRQLAEYNNQLAKTPQTERVLRGSAGGGTYVTETNKSYTELQGKIRETNKQLVEQGKVLGDLTNAARLSREGLAKAIEESLKFKPLNVSGGTTTVTPDKVEVKPKSVVIDFNQSVSDKQIDNLLKYMFDKDVKFDFIAPELIPPEETKRQATEFSDLFFNEINQYTGKKKVDLGLDKAVADQKLKLAELQRLAETVAGSISSAFSSAFESIANGANVFESLGQAIKAVIVDLIQAAIRGLIFKAVMNIILPGSGTATAGIGGLIGLAGRRALGGPVGAGRSYLVGENGPELFTPGISGNIVPNGRLGSVSNSFGGMQVQGVLTGRGNDLVAIISAAGRSNGRLI